MENKTKQDPHVFFPFYSHSNLISKQNFCRKKNKNKTEGIEVEPKTLLSDSQNLKTQTL